MKLIIVDRAKADTYTRLREQFANDPNVKVMFERRKGRRDTAAAAAERRRLRKSLEGRDYIVVYTADEESSKKRK